MTEQYRLCAAAVVFNSEGKVLLGNRSDMPDDAWQFPQGGIEENESPAAAATRELWEETSVVSVKCIYTAFEPFRYEFPQIIKDNFKKRHIFTDGQDVFFSLFYFEGKDDEIDLNTSTPEFCQYMWNDFDFAVEHVVAFKKSVYLSAARLLKPLIKQYVNSIS